MCVCVCVCVVVVHYVDGDVFVVVGCFVSVGC